MSSTSEWTRGLFWLGEVFFCSSFFGLTSSPTSSWLLLLIHGSSSVATGRVTSNEICSQSFWTWVCDLQMFNFDVYSVYNAPYTIRTIYNPLRNFKYIAEVFNIRKKIRAEACLLSSSSRRVCRLYALMNFLIFEATLEHKPYCQELKGNKYKHIACWNGVFYRICCTLIPEKTISKEKQTEKYCTPYLSDSSFSRISCVSRSWIFEVSRFASKFLSSR